MIVVADTSAVLAAFDASEDAHAPARAVMDLGQLVISPIVLAELDHLVRRNFGFRAALNAVESLTDRIADGDYALAAVTNDDLIAAAQIRTAYAGLELDLADGLGVVIADRYRTNYVFTLDLRDFRAIRPLTPGFDSFVILPAGG
ncbi:ribonuclease VapC26 [Mycolicibacterium insubricum]|uniref:Ribonuclease VapC n=1 Tax=Mycolicibacterium insubricum TaxID=444597 RepID=A0A1X0DAT2_9MYCO|nr:PIN domain-containing protein [Mycolicibacterium insubricum]MCV7083400.1 PIN domain-containing protein [Mycolicibacterium insubricum]ORA69515.1 VapC toxin family PIN domain ribonuclease [Mycolicibacterium insubricum]BBZ65635.1 ribonuclease VapC26 [Mycolicibacterium insubricum]